MARLAEDDSKISKDIFLLYKDALKLKGRVRCRIVSDSMEPIIKTGDVIEVKPLSKNPEAFDIIVFYQFEQLVCHMFIKRSEFSADNTYLLSSYKYGRIDTPLAPDDILGVVSSHKVRWYRKLWYVLRARDN